MSKAKQSPEPENTSNFFDQFCNRWRYEAGKWTAIKYEPDPDGPRNMAGGHKQLIYRFRPNYLLVVWRRTYKAPHHFVVLVDTFNHENIVYCDTFADYIRLMAEIRDTLNPPL